MNFELLPESPYNLARCSLVFGQLPSDGTDVWVPPREILPAQHQRLHVVEGEPILAITQQNEDARLTVRTYPARPRHLSALKARVTWQFHLDAPLGKFYRLAEKNAFFRPVIKNLYGVKPLRPSTVYEMAVIAISEQQLSLSFAIQVRSRLVEALGTKMIYEGKKYRAFPTPEAVAKCKISDLRSLSLSTRKAEYLIDFSEKVASGSFDVEDLRHRPNEEIVATLTSLRGFGRWSAEYLISRGLGRSEVYPADDVGIQALVGKYLGPGRRVNGEECQKIMKPWGNYKRWVVFYLFCASRLKLI